MKATLHTTNAERAGRWLGRAWRGYAQKEARAVRWLAGNGLPGGVVRLLFWIVAIAVFGVLLYAAFWLALLLLVAVILASLTRDSDHDDPEEWAIGDQANHKKSVFYDPINYSDDPDPRFDDKK
jgi:fatty acid desaturase